MERQKRINYLQNQIIKMQEEVRILNSEPLKKLINYEAEISEFYTSLCIAMGESPINNRKGDNVIIKFLLRYALRKKFGHILPLNKIGRMTYGKDHSTVIHSLKVVEDFLRNPNTHPKMDYFYQKIKHLINE